MADNGYKINKSLNLNPQAGAPANPANGDIYYDATIGTFVYYNQGAWACVDSIGSVVGQASMTSSLFTPAVVQHSVIRITTAGGTLHGMSATFTGKRVVVYNNSGASITVQHQSVSEASTNNRIITPNATNMTLIAGEVAQFMYDTTQARWLLVSVGSGAGAYAAATTATNGTVQLNTTPVNAGSPQVTVVDSSGKTVATGLTRGVIGTGQLDIGTGANDESIVIGRTAKFATVAGGLMVSETTSMIGDASFSANVLVATRTHDLYIPASEMFLAHGSRFADTSTLTEPWRSQSIRCVTDTAGVNLSLAASINLSNYLPIGATITGGSLLAKYTAASTGTNIIRLHASFGLIDGAGAFTSGSTIFDTNSAASATRDGVRRWYPSTKNGISGTYVAGTIPSVHIWASTETTAGSLEVFAVKITYTVTAL